MLRHKNSPKRYYGDYTYFATAKTKNNYPYFRNKVLADLWIEEFRLAQQLKQFETYGFCLLHDHFHLLIEPDNEVADISDVLHFFKRNFSRNANRLRDIEDSLSPVSEDDHPRPREIFKQINQFIIQNRADPTLSSIPRFQWQTSFHEHVIRDQRDFDNHLHYTLYNFRKHGLPADWEYTSLRL
jgi:putative transposase